MMKRFALLAICAMAVLAGCQQKGKSEGQTSGTVATDSLGEVTDTVPKPIFLIKRMSFFEMNYWIDVEEPSKEQLDEEYYKECYEAWSRQEAFRRRAEERRKADPHARRASRASHFSRPACHRHLLQRLHRHQQMLASALNLPIRIKICFVRPSPAVWWAFIFR